MKVKNLHRPVHGQELFFFFLAAKNARILHKNDCERKLFYIVNEKDTQ